MSKFGAKKQTQKNETYYFHMRFRDSNKLIDNKQYHLKPTY